MPAVCSCAGCGQARAEGAEASRKAAECQSEFAPLSAHARPHDAHCANFSTAHHFEWRGCRLLHPGAAAHNTSAQHTACLPRRVELPSLSSHAMVGRAVPHLSVVGSRWAVVTPCSECVDEREDFSADLTHLVSYSVVRVTQAQWSSSVQPYAQQRVRGATRPVARRALCDRSCGVPTCCFALHRACLATVCHNEWARRALSEGEPWRYRCGAGRSSEHDTQGDISLPSRLLGDDRKTPLPLHRATTGGRTEGLSERASKRANVVYVGAREGMREKASGAGTE